VIVFVEQISIVQANTETRESEMGREKLALALVFVFEEALMSTIEQASPGAHSSAEPAPWDSSWIPTHVIVWVDE